MGPARCFRRGVAIVQVSATQAALLEERPVTLSVPAPILGLDACAGRALVWTATRAYVFDPDASTGEFKTTSTFHVPPAARMVLHRDFIFLAGADSVQTLNKEAVPVTSLLLDEPQGKVLALDACDDHVSLVTSKGYIRRWKVDESSGRMLACGPCSKWKAPPGEAEAELVALRTNCDGSKLSFLITGLASPIFIYDCVLDRVLCHQLRSDMVPVWHCWDIHHPHLLVCEAKLVGEAATQLLTFFVTSDHGMVQQEKVLLDSQQMELLGLSVPFVLVHNKSDPQAGVTKRTMQLFEQMEHASSKMQTSLLQFNLSLAVGNMNDACRAVELVQDSCTWEHLARFCVKSGFLDPALYCFARVQNGMGGISAKTPATRSATMDHESRLASLAVQLGLVKDAEALYIDCKRYDLLIGLYQASGDWDKALNVASKHDPVHLKSTHQAYAKHLEGIGRVKEAMKHYELSETHRYEIPRMLVSLQMMDELENYVNKSKEAALRQWWAHFSEANDRLAKAIDYYTLAGDTASVVRVLWYLDEFKAATDTAAHCSDKLAAFQVARQHEKNGSVHGAMELFVKSGKAGYAARLAMRHGIDSDLLSLSLQSSKEIMISSAQYFEQKGLHEEAVLLYQKGGYLEKAIELCLRSRLFDALKAIADDLDEDADPEILSRCGDYLVSQKQMERAVELYIAAKRHDRALEYCTNGVTITEAIADRFTSEDKDLLLRLAECCEGQGSYHLACKKYTQAGDRVRGMKALLRSHDTERIVLFANASRQKQLYVLAAQYLQALEWHDDPILMKSIIQMYLKAGEMNMLAEFYEACAQIEIDEFRDYEKALGAMKEALKYATKSEKHLGEKRVEALQHRVSEIGRFVQIRRMAKNDPEGMILACSELLRKSTPETAVRVGDVCSLLVEYYFSQGNLEEAYSILETMERRQIRVDSYIDQHIVHAVTRFLLLPKSTFQ